VRRDRFKFRVLFSAVAVSLLLACLSFASRACFAQADKPPRANQFADNVKTDTPGLAIKPREMLHRDVDLALVNVTVTDPYNRLVTGLDPDNFRVYEDNVEQEITSFSSEDVPISIGVIFDVSGSMGNKINKAREAAIQFFKTANPQDEFFLVSFNERAELTSGFTNSVEDLQARMMMTPPKGRTALLDAISWPQRDEGCTQRQTRLAHHI